MRYVSALARNPQFSLEQVYSRIALPRKPIELGTQIFRNPFATQEITRHCGCKHVRQSARPKANWTATTEGKECGIHISTAQSGWDGGKRGNSRDQLRAQGCDDRLLFWRKRRFTRVCQCVHDARGQVKGCWLFQNRITAECACHQQRFGIRQGGECKNRDTWQQVIVHMRA